MGLGVGDRDRGRPTADEALSAIAIDGTVMIVIILNENKTQPNLARRGGCLLHSGLRRLLAGWLGFSSPSLHTLIDHHRLSVNRGSKARLSIHVVLAWPVAPAVS